MDPRVTHNLKEGTPQDGQRSASLPRCAEAQRAQNAEILARAREFGRALTGGEPLHSHGDPVDTATMHRAANPYSYHRSRAMNLSHEPAARNCVLELMSGELFERLAPAFKGDLIRSAKNPENFSAADYSIAPYRLGAGRWSGDLFVSELVRGNPCKTIVIRGGATRVAGVGADAPYGFLIMYKDSPLAAVSYVVTDGPSLLVVMTQRIRQEELGTVDRAEVKAAEKAAKRLHLKDAMLAVCSSVAKALECPSITYQGAINNRWVNEMVPQGPDDGWSVPCAPRMKFEDAAEIYDKFCVSRGFAHDPVTGNFFKVLDRK